MRGPRRRRRRQPAASRGSETDDDGLVEQHPLDAEIEVLAAAEPDGGADDVAGELPQGRVELVDFSITTFISRRSSTMPLKAEQSWPISSRVRTGTLAE